MTPRAPPFAPPRRGRGPGSPTTRFEDAWPVEGAAEPRNRLTSKSGHLLASTHAHDATEPAPAAALKDARQALMQATREHHAERTADSQGAPRSARGVEGGSSCRPPGGEATGWAG